MVNRHSIWSLALLGIKYLGTQEKFTNIYMDFGDEIFLMQDKCKEISSAEDTDVVINDILDIQEAMRTNQRDYPEFTRNLECSGDISDGEHLEESGRSLKESQTTNSTEQPVQSRCVEPISHLKWESMENPDFLSNLMQNRNEL